MIAAASAGFSSAATSSKLVDEMRDYVRALVRAHPEAAGDKKKKEAREDMVKKAGQQGVFEVTEDQEKKLRRRKDVVADGEYKQALAQLKSLNSKDPKVTFLIKYAGQERIKGAEKLLAYRLMKRDYAKAAEKASSERGKRVTAILAKYTAYKTAHSKPPASLADLDLPEDCKQFVNSKGEKVDWIYIGHLGPRLKANNSHVVLVEPEPLGDARICGMDSGEVVRFKNSSIEGQINKLVEAMKNGTVQPGAPGGGGGASSAALAAIMKKIALHKDLNNGKSPSTLGELELDAGHKTYTDPATGEKLPWIYLGDKSRIAVNNDTTVIIAAPKAHNGKRLVGLSNGKTAVVDDQQIAPLLK